MEARNLHRRATTGNDLPADFVDLPRHHSRRRLVLLCSKPKFGKSWLAYDLCIACTMGRFTLVNQASAR